MTIKPQALFADLLDDLEPHVPLYAYDCMVKGTVDLYPGVTSREVACMQLAASFLKKLKDTVEPTADDAALVKFKAANLRCSDWKPRGRDTLDDMLMGYFKKYVYEFLNPKRGSDQLVPDDLVSIAYASDLVGPGASVGATGNDLYSKLFASRLSCTSRSLYLAYRSYIGSLHPNWVVADESRKALMGEINVVSGNRLTFVPKSNDCSRVICVEPSLNMLFQKGIGNILERRLRSYFGISLPHQQVKNRELACLGSLTGDYVTIDLSSASDTISNRMLRHVLPKDFYTLLQLVRSPETEVSNTGEKIALSMVSTMGNGFTFPLQTMLFACVVASVSEVLGKKDRDFVPPRGGNLGSFGVNGDDIVCRREIADGVIRLLELLGFEVNLKKSFVNGHFRESCGGDFFEGLPVRGVYLKTLLEPTARYAAINALNDWSARHGIVLRRTVQRLLKTVRYLPVPVWEDPSAGIMVPYSMIEGLKVDKNVQSILYDRMVFEPIKLKISDCEIHVPSRAKGRVYNPSGLLLSFLHGAVKGTARKDGVLGVITIRHDSGRFRRKRGVAPNWESTSTVQPLKDPVWARRWKAAVWYNLMSEKT